jgi:pimeloyl-ACP methyl ester carboxylesterase
LRHLADQLGWSREGGRIAQALRPPSTSSTARSRSDQGADDIDNKGGAQVAEPLPIVLVPGLLTSPRLYAKQLPALWQHGPVTIASTTHDNTIAAIARRILAAAPPRFALAGLSMGGYICFELLRRAPDRIDRLALLDTTARPDTPELTQRRHTQIALARSGRFARSPTSSSPC